MAAEPQRKLDPLLFDEKAQRLEFAVTAIARAEEKRRRREIRRKRKIRLIEPLQRLVAEVSVIANGGFEGTIGESQKRASRALDRLNVEWVRK